MNTLHEYLSSDIATPTDYSKMPLSSLLGDMSFSSLDTWTGTLSETLGSALHSPIDSAMTYYYHEHCVALVQQKVKYRRAPLKQFAPLVKDASIARDVEVLRGFY